MTKKIKTTSNILLDKFYGNEQSAPGKFPFRSGIYDDMYRGKLWTMRQYAGFTSCEESNKRYKYLLSKDISPSDGNNKHKIISNNVLLPSPLFPIIPIISPFLMEKFTSFKR